MEIHVFEALVQVKGFLPNIGDKPLSEPMISQLTGNPAIYSTTYAG